MAAAYVARTCRVDHARARRASKRGRGRAVLSLDEAIGIPAAPALEEIDVLALNQALEELAALDGLQGRIVELRFFAGLTLTEIAGVPGVSDATVNRRWASAKAWLHHRLRPQ